MNLRVGMKSAEAELNTLEKILRKWWLFHTQKKTLRALKRRRRIRENIPIIRWNIPNPQICPSFYGWFYILQLRQCVGFLIILQAAAEVSVLFFKDVVEKRAELHDHIQRRRPLFDPPPRPPMSLCCCQCCGQWPLDCDMDVNWTMIVKYAVGDRAGSQMSCCTESHSWGWGWGGWGGRCSPE